MVNDDMKEKAIIGDVKIYCNFDKLVPIGEIKLNPKNPNKHTDEQIELLAYIFGKQGWRNPITISKTSGLVVKGEGRLLAAKLRNMEKVPVEYQYYESESQELADLIADNKIAEFSFIDEEALRDILLDIEDLDREITGYELSDIEQIINIYDDEKSQSPNEFQKYDEDNIKTDKICPKCGYEWS